MDCGLEIDLKSTSINDVGDSSLRTPSPCSDFVPLHSVDEVLYIHRFLLGKLPEFRAAASTAKAFDLLDVPCKTDHVIVHFLYTEKYDRIAIAPSTDALRCSFEIYTAVNMFGLIGLCKKAQEAIEAHTNGMDAAKALSALKKAHPLPDSGDIWPRVYAKTLVGDAYKDMSSFLVSDIMVSENAESKILFTEMILSEVISLVKEKELWATEMNKIQ